MQGACQRQVERHGKYIMCNKQIEPVKDVVKVIMDTLRQHLHLLKIVFEYQFVGMQYVVVSGVEQRVYFYLIVLCELIASTCKDLDFVVITVK